jgi:hypothetical protein
MRRMPNTGAYSVDFLNEFAAALARSLPRDVEFKSYDHLQNKLTLFKK